MFDNVYVFGFSALFANKIMPKVRRSRKSPPEGWELIEPTLEELEQKMREGNPTRKISLVIRPP